MTNLSRHDVAPACVATVPREIPSEANHGATDRARDVRRSRLARSAAVAFLGPLLVISLSALRSPTIMSHGRLWAEESYFLGHMLATDSLLHQVFYVYRGHIELLNSTVFAMASHLDLKVIPLVTSYCGLLIESVLAFMIVYFRADLEMRLRSALLICVLIVVSPCAVEHYLNLLNSVWLTSAILLLIINLPAERLTKHVLVVVPATFLLGLSGIPATCLMPLALLYAVVWRSRPHLVVAATLTLCCLIQGMLVLVHGVDGRFSAVSAWVYLAAPFFHIVVEHLLGVDAANVLGLGFRNAAIQSAPPLSLMLAPLAVLLWMTLLLVKKGEARARLLLIAIVYTTTVNITFAIGDRNELFSVYGMRYFFVPSFGVALLLARTDKTSSHWPPGLVLGVMTVVTLVSAGSFFQNPFYGIYVEQRHEWRREVERCQARATACSIEVDPGVLSVGIPDDVLSRGVR